MVIPQVETRSENLLSQDEIAENVEALGKQMRQILDRSLTMHRDERENSAAPIPIVNNIDWMGPQTFIGFLRDVGKHFRVNHMINKDSVRERLEEREQGISYTEFSYMIIQAYDFLHLFSHHDCLLQVGGSDQWGNITAGTDLIRRTEGESAFGVTFPLLTDSEGNKFGKSTGGAVWLDPSRTSPYTFYQYWVRRDDADMPALLRAFTFLPSERIEELCAHLESGENRGEVQRLFAHEMTWLVHGKRMADAVVNASGVLFGSELEGLEDADLEAILGEVPSTDMERTRLQEGIPIIDLFCEVGLQPSKGAARRLLDQGGLYLNNTRQSDRELSVSTEHLGTETMMLLRAGKKKYHIIRVV